MEAASARPIRHDESAAVAEALARAFHDDPVMEFLVPERKREMRIARFFGLDLHALRTRGEVYTTSGLEGGALWAAPGRWRMPLTEVARHAPTAVRSFGRQLPRALRALSTIEARHPDDRPHWYLAVLGTAPEHQGKGIGSMLLEPILSRCDSEGTGAYLESSKESNISYYRRHGFEITEAIELRGGPTVWGMWRDPRP